MSECGESQVLSFLIMELSLTEFCVQYSVHVQLGISINAVVIFC
jgi:hypothetical protein